MKQYISRSMFLLLLLLVVTTYLRAQYGFGTNSPHSSAVVDMTSANKGVLFPRVSLASTGDLTPIPQPALNLVVFNTNTTTDLTHTYSPTNVTPGLYLWNGTSWVRLLTSDGPVGVNVAAPQNSAVLDVTSSDKGMLPPRMTSAQIVAISNPIEGLLVYNTDLQCLMYYVYNSFKCAFANPGTTGWTLVADNQAPLFNDITNTAAFLYDGSLATVSATNFWDKEGDLQDTPVYQWYRCNDAAGNGRTAITYATAETYTFTAADGGKYIQAGVQAVARSGTNPGAEKLAKTFLGPVWTCGMVLTRHHSVGGVAPESKDVDYRTLSVGGKCWIKQNLGASRPAESVGDLNKDTYGWYWQFDRTQGYAQSTTSDYIPDTSWRDNAYGTAKQNWTSDTDPCNRLLGDGWYVPTLNDWSSAAGSWWGTLQQAFDSPLKIIRAGQLYYSSGKPTVVGQEAYLWTASYCPTNVSSDDTRATNIWITDTAANNSSSTTVVTRTRRTGMSVRCVHN